MLVFPLVVLHGMACPPLGFVINILFSPWQLSPDLLASSYLNNNKTYILKHDVNDYSFAEDSVALEGLGLRGRLWLVDILLQGTAGKVCG